MHRHSDGGAPIRLLHANDVTYCNGWQPKKTRQLKQETKLGKTRARPATECQDFCERAVHVSEVENRQCEVPGLSNVDEIVSGLSEVDRGFILCESSFLDIWKLREE